MTDISKLEQRRREMMEYNEMIALWMQLTEQEAKQKAQSYLRR